MRKQTILLAAAITLIALAGMLLFHQFSNPADAPQHSDSSLMITSNSAAKLKFLALGDSYTIGESVEPSDRWPNQLADRLRKAGVDISDPDILARTGWTTRDLLAAMDAEKLADGKYNLVMLLIGVNNQYQSRSQDEYRTQFAQLLQRSIQLAAGREDHVIVLSIPDYSVTPFGQSTDPARIAKEIDQFNQINREETGKTKAAWVDITPASRSATNQPDWVANDGLHPSAKQYISWVDQAFNTTKTRVSAK